LVIQVINFEINFVLKSSFFSIFQVAYLFNLRRLVFVNSIPQLPFVVVTLNDAHKNISFTTQDICLLNGTAYDFYSLNELGHNSRIGQQWRIFPLPNETILHVNFSYPLPRSQTGLAFVDRIYIVTTAKLTDRHENLRRLFDRYHIRNYEWRMKWTRKNCSILENQMKLSKYLNLNGYKRLVKSTDQRLCPITMEHTDIWHDIIRRNSSLSLILEDDAVFVPNFAEKFNRTIYTTLRTGFLRLGGLSSCSNSSQQLNQNPMIVIGGCVHFHDDNFQANRTDAPPILSQHKQSGTRCTHGYLLTACSARDLLKQIPRQLNPRLESDFFMNVLIANSPTLQAFWLDPPIVYQGNQVIDLDGIPSFQLRTY